MFYTYISNIKSFFNRRNKQLFRFNLKNSTFSLYCFQPTDRSQFETVAEEIDATECDALYIVGGDSALSAALSALNRRNDFSAVPVGVFPGGFENRSLSSLVPNVFG